MNLWMITVSPSAVCSDLNCLPHFANFKLNGTNTCYTNELGELVKTGLLANMYKYVYNT